MSASGEGGAMEQNSRGAVALARPEANAGSAGARAGAQLAPGAPAAVLPHLVGVLPHAVTFVAPLQAKKGKKKDGKSEPDTHEADFHGTNLTKTTNKTTVCSLTFPGAHSVPSRGGPFLVLQK